jgi:hypothetical protein
MFQLAVGAESNGGSNRPGAVSPPAAIERPMRDGRGPARPASFLVEDAEAQSRALKLIPARIAGVVTTAAVAVAAARPTHKRRIRLVISAPFPAACCRRTYFGAGVISG